MKVRVSEVFSSIQGEGIWAGIPSVFIRLSGCNLRCIWCDTPYASWYPEGPIVELTQLIGTVRDYGVHHVVVTGGEPMLFDPIVDLCNSLKESGHIITIETAGTISRDLSCDLMSISPKLSNSMTPDGLPEPLIEQGWVERHESTRINLEVLRHLTLSYRFQLKFVVNPEEDLSFQLDEIDKLVASLGHRIDSQDIILMPEGRETEKLNRRAKLLVPVCMERGFRLGPRLHVDLFGDTRGT